MPLNIVMREVQVKSMLFKQDEGLVLITADIDLSLNPIFIFEKSTPLEKNTLCQQALTCLWLGAGI